MVLDQRVIGGLFLTVAFSLQWCHEQIDVSAQGAALRPSLALCLSHFVFQELEPTQARFPGFGFDFFLASPDMVFA